MGADDLVEVDAAGRGRTHRFADAVLAICLGCRIFALLMRAGIIPPEVCLACSDLSGRLAAATTGSAPASSSTAAGPVAP